MKALAWYFYENSVDVNNRENVIDCAILAANIIKQKDNSDKGKYLHLIWIFNVHITERSPRTHFFNS